MNNSVVEQAGLEEPCKKASYTCWDMFVELMIGVSVKTFSVANWQNAKDQQATKQCFRNICKKDLRECVFEVNY